MRTIKALVYDSKSYTQEAFENTEHDGIEFTYVDTKLNKHTVKLAKDYDTIVTFVNDDLGEEVIEKLIDQGKKAVFLRCSGYNNVDLKKAKGKIDFYRVPNYSPYAIGEFTFALLLTSMRRTHKAYNRTREFNFSLEGFVGIDLQGKTIGVIGTGRIGRVVIDIANGFKMNVLAYDPYQKEKNGPIKYVSLNELIKKSDIITLHCPLTKKTEHMIDKKAIDKMKKGVVIINTSRGGLIDSKALLKGIESRKVSSACLDVYEEEADIFYEDRSNHILNDETLRDLISMPNVIVTSHQAFLTKEALNNIAMTTISNIRRYFSGDPDEDNHTL